MVGCMESWIKSKVGRKRKEGTRQRIRGDTTKIKDDLRGSMRINYNKNVNGICMKSPNNGGNKGPAGHFLPPNEASSTRTRSNQLSVGCSGPIGNHKQPWLLPNYSLPSTNWLQGPIAEEKPIQCIGHKDIQLIPT